LVIRLSSLGDVVLCGAVTGQLGDVVFLTHRRWAPVARRLKGVERVVVFGEDPIPSGIQRVIDLQASPRSLRVRRGLGVPVSVVARHDLRRRLRVWTKGVSPPPPVVERYARAAGVPVGPLPWFPPDEQDDGHRDALLMCVGAAWATKRWPADRWVDVGGAWDGPVVVLGGPDDTRRVAHIAGAIGAEGVAEQGFDTTFAAVRRAAAAVGGDTGLTHLCAAAGIPTVGIFGPTTSTDGFWHWRGPALERDLDCRPCSRHGGVRCAMRDHACLRGLPAAHIIEALGTLAAAIP
jgi:ADP-heptose:LPS heptosyltransferase